VYNIHTCVQQVLIGCNASVLGNITVGDCCKIGSGSIVLKALPPYVTAVGSPAKIVGTSAPTVEADGELKPSKPSTGIEYISGIQCVCGTIVQ
jgi:serine acetyltransferase